MPDVTVVITCFELGAYVGEAVDSALKQDAHVIVVDDGSREPATLAALDALPDAVELVRQENRGVAAARNAGLERVRTPYALVLDGDDRLAPGALATLRGALDGDPEVGFAYGLMEQFGQMTGVLRFPPYDPYALLYRHTIGLSALARTEIFERTGGFDPSFGEYEDWELWLHALACGWRGRQVPEVTLHYRRRAGSKFGSDRRAYRGAVRALRAKHAGLYARRAELARESALGALGRAWYRRFWGTRPVPARVEAAVHRLLWASGMTASLRRGAAAWWRLGPVAGTRAAAKAGVRIARAPARRARLRVAPLRARPRDVRQAVGGDAVVALRGPALAALPSVGDLERRLDAYGHQDRRSLLERADAICAHRFDLLGSGPVDLGPTIDWRTDFKTGRRWPLAHISQVPIVFGDGSDIKVPWELTRFQHLPLLAAAHRLSGERRYLDEIGAQLDSFIAANPVEFGPNWACTMDVAIRAANWVAALALVAEARPPWLDRAVASLLLHGRFIRSHPEWGETRGNHYLSDIVGLLPVATLFRGGREGRAWMAWGARELAAEMEHQVRPDGTDHEASIPYHGLVAELFVAGTHAVDSQLPDAFTPAYRERLEAMLGFTAAYTRPDGDAPMVGDNDSGRFLPLDGYGGGYRSHRHLLDDRPTAGGHAAFPDGGYWVLRGGDMWVLVRCGDVGLNGIGGHAHNDALSFELSLGDQPLVVDPGTFVYTPDAAERNRFRSTAWHSTLQVGDEEQNPLRSDYLFQMDDRRRARALEWAPGDDGRAIFAGRHEGFPGATHERRFEFDGLAGTLALHDTLQGADGRTLTWTFPLPPGARVGTAPGEAIAEIGAARLTIRGEGLDFTVEEGSYAPVYGVREPAPFVRARRAGTGVQRITLSATRQ